MRLVSVPGLGLDERSQAELLSALGRGAGITTEVACLPGMGQRGQGDVAVAAAALRARVGSGAGELVLIGHSASCQVVARAARTLPVSGLVLLGPTTDPRLRPWLRMLLAWLRTAAREDPRQLPTLLAQYTRTGPWSMLQTMNLFRRERIEDDLAAAAPAVLVVRGIHDRIADEVWVRRCAGRGGPGSRAANVPGAHVITQTAPEAVAAQVLAFLAALQQMSPCRA